MNKNDYYLKYLKYKMKYLREKEMQIGGTFKLKLSFNLHGESSVLEIDVEPSFTIQKVINDLESEYNDLYIYLMDESGLVKLESDRTLESYSINENSNIQMRFIVKCKVIIVKRNPDELHDLELDSTDTITKVKAKIIKEFNIITAPNMEIILKVFDKIIDDDTKTMNQHNIWGVKENISECITEKRPILYVDEQPKNKV